jgi:curved DNA-binding protein CbpA
MEHIGIYLRDVFLKKKQGRLSFYHQNFQKYLFFQDGFLVYAKTNHPLELLGQVLFRLGKLSKEDFERIDEYIEPKKSIGLVLLDRGVITKQSLEEGLTYQMREVTLNMFSAFDAELKFQPMTDFSEREFDLKLKVPRLIEAGIRGMKHDPSLESFLADKIPFTKSIDFYLRLNEQERELFDMIKGESSAEQLMSKSNMKSDFFWKSLYLLYCLNLVDLKKGARQEEEKPSAPSSSPLHASPPSTPPPSTPPPSAAGATAAAAEKAEPPPEEGLKGRIAEALEFHQNLEKLDYYQILGVERDVSPDEVKKSYFKLARKFHPDLFGRQFPPETLKKIDEVFDRITKAYNTLSDERKKSDYNDQRKFPAEDARKNQAKEAEKRFRQGKTLFDQSRYDEALVFLEQAVRLSQDKAKYFLLLALTQAKLYAYRKEAEKNFIRATKLEPWNAEAFAGLGLLYKREGLHIKARKQFQRALQIDPDHRVAKKEMRGEKKPSGKTGLKDITLKSLFGKKKHK